jgi:hypothetical protein
MLKPKMILIFMFFIDRKVEQVRSHLAQVRRRHSGYREVDQQSPSLASVRVIVYLRLSIN